jgi:5-methylcytosine-specific restriction endonuclease McrA
MIAVDPNARTTLVLNKNFQSLGKFFTARATIRHLMNGRVKGLDASGNCVSWSGADVENFGGTPSSLNWSDVTVDLYPDQPCLRSAPNALTGTETQWPIPTLVVCTHHFGYHPTSSRSLSLKSIYSICRGTCQYCLQKIPFSEATKDHIYPKSLGGTNDDFNVVMACRACNSAKDNSYPYYDAEGKHVKPISGRSVGAGYIPDNLAIREEWKPFLFLK